MKHLVYEELGYRYFIVWSGVATACFGFMVNEGLQQTFVSFLPYSKVQFAAVLHHTVLFLS